MYLEGYLFKVVPYGLDNAWIQHFEVSQGEFRVIKGNIKVGTHCILFNGKRSAQTSKTNGAIGHNRK